MYNGFFYKNTLLSIIATLFILIFSSAEADNYQPMPGSFRPPSLGGTSSKQSGFRQDNSQHITAPSQQQAWTPQPIAVPSQQQTWAPQPYVGSPSYYPPTAQPAPAYQQQNTQNDTWRRSISVNPGNLMNDIFGFGNNTSNSQAATDYQPPAYQPYVPQAPVYQQQHYYGSSYPLQQGYATPQIPQQPVVIPSNPQLRTPAPFTRSPFGGENTRFRPPALKGTD